MKPLVLIGDSCACGEWALNSSNQIDLSQPGITEYLQPTRVVNLSRSGNSLWQILYTLHNYLSQKNSRLNDDFNVILFQTDSTRKNLCSELQVDLESVYRDCLDLTNLYSMLNEIFYIKCNQIGDRFNRKIYLSGGLTDLDLDLLSGFDNIIPICPSWIHLLDPTHKLSVLPLQVDSSSLTTAKNYNRWDLCEQISDHSDNCFLELQKKLESEYFGPTYGDYHPSRLGHKILADYINLYFENQK